MRFTNLRASRKSGNLKVFVMWCSSMTFQPPTCVSRAARSTPLSGGTPPRQGTHVLAARSDIVEVILPPARETLTPVHYCRSSELFGMRKDERLVQPNSLGCAWKKESSSVYRLGIRSLVASDRRRRTGDEC